MSEKTVFTIEHNAVLIALLSKYADQYALHMGNVAMANAVMEYGEERGARMMMNAAAHKDRPTFVNSRIYTEWVPDFKGQIESEVTATEPALETSVTKCPWNDAWEKHGLSEYAGPYCQFIGESVMSGFNTKIQPKLVSEPLSEDGDSCDFDWGQPLSEQDLETIRKKKAELGTSCTMGFDFHTAHAYSTMGRILKGFLGEELGGDMCQNALTDFANIFGQEYADRILELQNEEF